MPWFVGLITALMGAGAMALGLWIYFDDKDFNERAIYVDAKVLSVEVSVSKSRDSDGRTTTSTTYYPTVEFTDAEGKSRVAKSTTGSSDYNFPTDTWTEIGYDPENRSDVRVRSNDNPIIALAFFGFIGGIFFIIGIAFLIGSIRNRNKPDPFEDARARMEAMRAEMEGQAGARGDGASSLKDRYRSVRRNR